MRIQDKKGELIYDTRTNSSLTKGTVIENELGKNGVVYCLQNGKEVGSTQKNNFAITKSTFKGLKTKLFKKDLGNIRFLMIRNEKVKKICKKAPITLDDGRSASYSLAMLFSIKSLNVTKFIDFSTKNNLAAQLTPDSDGSKNFMDSDVMERVLQTWSDGFMKTVMSANAKSNYYELPFNTRNLTKWDTTIQGGLTSYIEDNLKDFGITADVLVGPVPPNA